MTADEQDDDRPWERPGAVRRDGEPHRANLLFRLMLLSSPCACAAFLAIWFALDAVNYALPLAACLLASALGVALDAAIWVVARWDLELMRTNLVDAQGRALTEDSLAAAKSCLRFDVACWLVGGVVAAYRLLP